MSCYFYLLILQVFTPKYILLHIHVLTCVNVPIMLGHVTTQNKHCFVELSFSITEFIIQVRDKLLPGTKPGFLKSEENVKLHTFIYTKSVSENICVYYIIF